MNTSFERCENTKVEWLTPPDFIIKLGQFEFNPFYSINVPFLLAHT